MIVRRPVAGYVVSLAVLVAAAFFLFEPRFSFVPARPEHRLGVFLFVLFGVAAIAIFESLWSAVEQASAKGELLQTALTSMGDAVITTDAQSRVVTMNAEAESLTGWSIRDARQQPLAAVFRVLHASSREPAESPAARALGSGAIVGRANRTILVSKDNSEHHIEDSAAPLRRHGRQVTGSVLVFRDIGERRQQEREIESREQQFQTLAESMPQLVWMAHADGSIFWYNRRWYDYTGTTFEQMSGWGWQSVHDSNELPKVLERWRASIATGEEFDMVFPLRGRDGVFHPFLTRVVPVRDEEGRVKRWFGTNTDITAAKAAEEELRALTAKLSEADHRKDEFLATLAHELRNPLAPVKNSLELMKHAEGNRDLMEKARATMERQISQMVRLIDDLLDVSRITSNKLELRTQRMELAPVLTQVVDNCRPECARLGHQLTVTLPPEPVFLDGDQVRMAQLFGNLLTNACKYTPRGGRIWLTAERQGSSVVVKVKDSGVGIPPEMLGKVFDLFAQVDRTLDRSEGGLGIGLSLVKRLVEMHGGTVEAHSEGAGRGSEFVVRLPILLTKPEGRPLSPPAGERVPAPVRRILVVDDNRDSADSLAQLLSLTGNDTRTAHDGEEGVLLAEDFRPDVVLLDIGLPKLNGYEVCRKIREQPWGKGMAVVALTGWGQDDDRRKSKEAGFNGHMVKPVDLTELMRLLATISANGGAAVTRTPAEGTLTAG